MIPDDNTDFEKIPKQVKNIKITSMLYDAKFRQDLKADTHRWLTVDSYEETTFAVDKARDPIRIEPFLLIVRTHTFSLQSPFKNTLDGRPVVVWDTRMFQHIVRFC